MTFSQNYIIYYEFKALLFINYYNYKIHSKNYNELFKI